MPTLTGYARDLNSPARFVATECEKVAPGPLLLSELAKRYRHPVPSDYTRVRSHEQVEEGDEAEWLLREAALQVGLAVDGDEVRLTGRFDELQQDGQKLHRLVPNETTVGGHEVSPFDPQGGVWAENIRTNPSMGRDDLTELRESMRAWGWDSTLPAIRDERGVILSGHRRLKVAAELGIEPVIRSMKFGKGAEADAERTRLALLHNLGGRPLTKGDRIAIAMHLYHEKKWSQQRIAEALHVSRQTIGGDIEEGERIANSGNSFAPAPKRQRGPKVKLSDDQVQAAAESVKQGVAKKQVAADLGVSPPTLNNALKALKAKEEKREEEPATAAPPPAAEPKADTGDSTCSNEKCAMLEAAMVAVCEAVGESYVQKAVERVRQLASAARP